MQTTMIVSEPDRHKKSKPTIFRHYIITLHDVHRVSMIAYEVSADFRYTEILNDVVDINSTLKVNGIRDYSTHMVETDHDSWNSVAEEDPYFEHTVKFYDLAEFINFIKEEDGLEYLTTNRYLTFSYNYYIVNP